MLGVAMALTGGTARAQWRVWAPVGYLDLVEDYSSGDAESAVAEVCTWSRDRTLEAASSLATFVLAATDDATALVDALYAAKRLHEAGERRGVVVVFSDGVENMSWLLDDEVAEAARRADVLVHGITLTPDRPAGWATLSSGQAVPALPHENDLLRRAAAATGGRLWHAATSAHLESVFVGVLREIRSRYILAHDPEPAGQRGWHSVRVTVKAKGRQVSARPGYFAR